MKLRSGSHYPGALVTTSTELERQRRAAHADMIDAWSPTARSGSTTPAGRGQPTPNSPLTSTHAPRMTALAAMQVRATENGSADETLHERDFAGLASALQVGDDNSARRAMAQIADGRVKPQHFFAEDAKPGERSLNLLDHQLAFLREPERPDYTLLRRGEGQPVMSPANRFAYELSRFDELLQACSSEHANPKIRAALTTLDYGATATYEFLWAAAGVLPMHEGEVVSSPMGLLTSRLDDLCADMARGRPCPPPGSDGPTTDNLFRALVRATAYSAHPDSRAICHHYAEVILATLPPDPERLEHMLSDAVASYGGFRWRSSRASHVSSPQPRKLPYRTAKKAAASYTSPRTSASCRTRRSARQ